MVLHVTVPHNLISLLITFFLLFLMQRLQVEGLDDLVLQRLWFQVNQGVLKKVRGEIKSEQSCTLLDFVQK